jgi:hypothetical protein
VPVGVKCLVQSVQQLKSSEMWRVSDWRGELLEFLITEDGGSELIRNRGDYSNLQGVMSPMTLVVTRGFPGY